MKKTMMISVLTMMFASVSLTACIDYGNQYDGIREQIERNAAEINVMKGLENAFANNNFFAFNSLISNSMRQKYPDIKTFKALRDKMVKIDQEEGGFFITWSNNNEYNYGETSIARLIGKKSGTFRAEITFFNPPMAYNTGSEELSGDCKVTDASVR